MKEWIKHVATLILVVAGEIMILSAISYYYSDGTIGNCEDIKIVGNIHINPELMK